MLFNSPGFLALFLPITVFLYYRLGRRSATSAFVFLSLASLFFYAIWSLRDLALILASIGANYFFSRRISEGTRHTKSWLRLGICFNLGLLVFFKYTRFALETVGLESSWAQSITLPLAISFYSFQQISYLVHTYRLQAEGLGNQVPPLHKYSLFILFFPHLVSGPIVRDSDLVHQIEPRAVRFQPPSMTFGIALFCIGLAKKMAVADYIFAPHADLFFELVHSHGVWNTLDALSGTFAYAMQIYFDFSGYSDMALGLAALFNFTLPINFNSPYRASSIADFWRRWHITLSNFLRDFLYIPLGGNRAGATRTYVNLLVTMLIGGLWHGASWNFVLWGALHGFFLALQRAWKIPLPAAAARTLTLLAVILAWIPFRAHTLEETGKILESIFRFSSEGATLPVRYRAFLIGFLLTQLPFNSTMIATYLSTQAKFRAVLEYFGNYLVSWKPIAAIGTAFAGMLLLAQLFYGHEIDFYAYQRNWLRSSWPVGLVDGGEGSYRQNFLNTHFVRWRQISPQPQHQQIAVVGSSFATEIASATFRAGEVNHHLSSLATNGNTFDGSLRTIGTLLRYRPHAVMIAFHPVNLDSYQNRDGLKTFSPEECVDAYNEAAPDFPMRVYREKNCRASSIPWPALSLEPLESWFQIRAFFKKSEFNRETYPPFSPLVLGEKKWREALASEAKGIAPALPSDLPWPKDHPLSLLDPGGDFDKIFSSLKRKLTAEGIELILYSTPTNTSTRIYSPGYYEQYQQKISALAARHAIAFHDLSNLLPIDQSWMSDFIHATPRARNEIIPYALAEAYLRSCEKGEIKCRGN